MSRIGKAAAEAARRAAEAAERARKAAEAAQRAAQQASKGASAPRSTASTFETARPRPPVALDARPQEPSPSGGGVPRHALSQWTAPGPALAFQGPDAPAAFMSQGFPPDGPEALALTGQEPAASASKSAGQGSPALAFQDATLVASEGAAVDSPAPASQDATLQTGEGAVQGPPAPTSQDGTPVAGDGTTGETAPTSDAAAATTDPTFCDLTTADAAEINALAEENPAEAARRMEELVTTDPKYQDPAQVDALLRNCAPALTRIYEVLGKRAEDGDLDDSANTPYTRDTLEALATVTSRATPAMQQQVGRDLAVWLPDGDLNQVDDILGELAAGGGEGTALYNALFTALSATKPAAAQQLEAERVEAATVEFNEAQAEVDALNQELAALIGAAGPGLTQAEYDAIVANFMAEHSGAYERYEAAGAELTGLIAGNEDVLAHPEQYDPALVESVRGAVQELPELAQTQAGFEYLNNEMLAAGKGEPSLFDQLTPDANWLKSPAAFYESLSGALVEAAGRAMVLNRPGEAEAMLAFLEAKPHLFGLDAKEAKQLRRDLHAIHMGALRGHTPQEMEQHFRTLQKHIDDFGLSSRGADRLKALGAIVGLAGTGFDGSSASAFLRSSMDILGGSADFVSGVLGTASRIGKALGPVSLGTGFVTGVLDTAQAYGLAQQGEWDHAASSGMFALSGFAPLAGLLMGVPGLGTLVGGLLLAGGAGLGWWANQNDSEEHKQQRLDAMLKAGVPEHVAKVLVDADPFRMQQLQSAGFTPDQIRVIAERYPGMLLAGDTAYPVDGVYLAVMNGAFTPDEVMAMLDAASQGGTDPIGAGILLTAFAEASLTPGQRDGLPTTREGWVELLRTLMEDGTGSVATDEGRAVIERALAVLG